MNEQTTQNNPTAPTMLPAKRRRGRPRKDGGPAKRGNLQSPVTPAPESIKKVQNNAAEVSQKDGTIGGTVVGQLVSGIIDGCFDAGYFISVRVGTSPTTLRGLVFQPGRFAPITAANDVAPSATMYHRNQVVNPYSNQDQNKGIGQPIQQNKQLNIAPGQVLPSKPMSSAPFVPNNQFASAMAPPSDTVMATNEARSNIMVQQIPDQRQIHSQTTFPVENLRMVEQDEVMQVFEVANQSEGAKINAEPGKRVLSETFLEPKASEGTSNQGAEAQNHLMGSIFQSQILLHNNHNSSSGEIHHNPSVAKPQETVDNQPAEFESKNDKQPNPNQSLMQTLLQPGELVQCEAKKLEIYRAPVNDQTQLYPQGLPAMNQEIQLKEWSHGGEQNQQNQFHQSTLFAELNSVAQETQAAETEVQPSVQVHNELKSTFPEHQMPRASDGTNENKNPDINQVLMTGETQAVPQESMRTSMDFMMENLSYPKNEKSQNTHIAPEVELAGDAETSNETKEARDAGDKLALGSLLAPQQKEAHIENSDHSAKVETLYKGSDDGNSNLEVVHQGQQNQP